MENTWQEYLKEYDEFTSLEDLELYVNRLKTLEFGLFMSTIEEGIESGAISGKDALILLSSIESARPGAKKENEKYKKKIAEAQESQAVINAITNAVQDLTAHDIEFKHKTGARPEVFRAKSGNFLIIVDYGDVKKQRGPGMYQLTNFDIVSLDTIITLAKKKEVTANIEYLAIQPGTEPPKLVGPSPVLLVGKALTFFSDFIIAIRTSYPGAELNKPPTMRYEDVFTALRGFMFNPNYVPNKDLMQVGSYGFDGQTYRTVVEVDGEVRLVTMFADGTSLYDSFEYRGKGINALWTHKYSSFEESREHLGYFAKYFPDSQNRSQTMVAIGWMVSAFLVDQLKTFTKSAVRIPHLYVYGETSGGKSTTFGNLFKCFGWRGPSGAGEEIDATPAALRETLGNYSAPMLLGEVEASRMGGRDALEKFFGDLKATYDNFSSSKMSTNPDGTYSAGTTTSRGAVCMLSNFELPTDDAAIINRLIIMNITASGKCSMEKWYEIDEYLSKVPRGAIGAAFIIWALNNQEKIEEIAQSYKGETREEKNANTIIMGLKIFRELLISYGLDIDGFEDSAIESAVEAVMGNQGSAESPVLQYIRWVLSEIYDKREPFFWHCREYKESNDHVPRVKLIIARESIEKYYRSRGVREPKLEAGRLTQDLKQLPKIFTINKNYKNKGQSIKRHFIDVREACMHLGMDIDEFPKVNRGSDVYVISDSFDTGEGADT